MERQQIVIDDVSTIHAFRDPSALQIIVFIHGIFGSSTETWAGTPNQLMTSPTFSKFDYCSYGYKSKIVEWQKPDAFVDQLVLWMRTHLRQYKDIFLICHSMGGLLARQAVINMLGDKLDWPTVRSI